jgi:hypothetical protein
VNSDLSIFRDPLTGEPLNFAEDALVGSDGSYYPVVFGASRFVE